MNLPFALGAFARSTWRRSSFAPTRAPHGMSATSGGAGARPACQRCGRHPPARRIVNGRHAAVVGHRTFAGGRVERVTCGGVVR